MNIRLNVRVDDSDEQNEKTEKKNRFMKTTSFNVNEPTKTKTKREND